ncbi:MAG: family 16 glycosylhydrolase [Niastella sp.]|nr:family 16 glycosylhydrolase [Niastella sp.]
MKKQLLIALSGLAIRPGQKIINGGVCMILFMLVSHALSAQVLCQRQLVWQDEFNTPGNLSKWIVYEGDGCNEGSGCGFGNAELQLYRAANAVVADTTLTIFTRRETVVNPVNNRTYQYTSAKLMSKIVGTTGTLQSFKFGRIEARMQLPSAGGAWPAFWMLPEGGGWPNTGEIDIMEAKHKNPTVFNGTLHYAYPAGVHQQTGMQYAAGIDLSTGYHVYAVEWSPYRIDWYIDNILFQSQTPENTIGGSWPFDASKMYIILNTAVGGPNTPYTGKIPPTPADYPTNMKVDYVRVYNGIYNYAVFGKNMVYPNETFADYYIDTIPGASYNWSVPAGATIVSGQGTNAISVNWGTTPGDVTVSVTTPGCSAKTFSRKVLFKQPLGASKVYDDFEGTRLASYGPLTGTLVQAVANPLAERMNTSSLVGRYTRNAAIQYDNFYIGNMEVTNAMDFVQGRKKLFIDVYTTAPVGTEIDMQLENTALSSVNAFPSGRHSKYVAFTTRQNSWQTLEFNYTQTIANSNTSIFAIDKMAILPEPGKFTNNIYHFDNVRVAQSPAAAWTVIAADTLENYNGTSLITFDTASSGAYTVVSNPSPGGINNSSSVARYVRDPGAAYDVLFFDAGNTIPSAGPFKNQLYQIQMDVYTSAPIGTEVSVNLQNKVLGLQPFPSGRNSSYQSITTKQNQWETLTFYYSSAPNGASNLAIDQLVFLFSPNKPATHTYYIDNIRIGKKATYGTAGSTVFEDYDASHLFTYQLSDGTYAPNTANPAPNGVNASALTGRYTRSAAAQYDVVFFTTSDIKDGEMYKQGAKLFAMDVYTTAPVGTPISWQLESSAKSNGSNYPRGRHSNYQGKVAQTNAWHTLYFYLDAVPDANTLDAEVDRVVLLFAPNSTTNHVYHIDNLRSLNATTSQTPAPPTTGLPSPWQHADIGAVAAAGNATFSNNIFTITASGADIWGTADEFHYVYQPFSGNGQIIARVDTLGNTNAAAKAAIMFRETLDANSKEVNSLVKATGGTSISYRTNTGGTTANVNAAGTPPKWLKLVRNGDVFTASRSDDGVTWTSFANRTITMGTNIYVGMAVTSHNDGVITTSRFSNVSVTSGTLLSATGASTTTLSADEARAAGFVLYPNPAKENLTVQWKGQASQLSLYDVSGRLVSIQKVAAGQQLANLSLGSLSKGIYLVHIRLADGTKVIKFQKE